jgi:hypothetical protein
MGFYVLTPFFIGFDYFLKNTFHSVLFRPLALAKNSSFGFWALAFVSAKTKCAVCAVGFLYVAQHLWDFGNPTFSVVRSVAENCR